MKKSPAAGERDKGNTKPEQHEGTVPRLPHERDESADNQSSPDRPGTDVTRQGYEDVARGLVDTDRGPEMDKRRLNRVPPDPPETPKPPPGGKARPA
jgi:hypothetical protein